MARVFPWFQRSGSRCLPRSLLCGRRKNHGSGWGIAESFTLTIDRTVKSLSTLETLKLLKGYRSIEIVSKVIR